MEGGHSIYGLDRIIVEGTPTDGSRNFYSDMVRATLHFDAAKKLDVFALYDSGRSDLRWGNSRSRGRSLNCINMTDTSDLDEWGGGLVYSQNAFDGDLPFKVYPDFPRSNEKPQDFLGFCLKVFTTLVFYVAEGLSDILGGGWSGSVKPRRFSSKATSSFGST